MARLLLTAGLVMVILALCSAQSDTTGKQLSGAPGYTFGSNVEGYLAVSKDVCDYVAAVSKQPPDWAAAEKIYTTGGNSKKSDGTIRTLQSLTGPYLGEPFFDLYAAYYGSPKFMDEQITAALKGAAPFTAESARLEGADKSVKTMLQWVYLMHELDEAADKITKKQLSATNGAPHNVDETWAIYVGEAKLCGLFEQVQARGRNFGTMMSCQYSNANQLALNSHNQMYRAAQQGDARAFERARKDMERVMLIQNIQNVLRYSTFMDQDLAGGKDVLDDQAEAYAFFRIIAPLLNTTNPATVKQIKAIMYPGTPVQPNTVARVSTALEPVLPKWNLTWDDVGSVGAPSPYSNCPNATSSAAPVAGAVRYAGLAGAAAGAVFVALL